MAFPVVGLPYPAQQAPLNPLQPAYPTKAFWTWTNPGSINPQVQYYFGNSPTKTGLTPADLSNFVGVPVQINNPASSIPTPIPDNQLLSILRQSEDWVETESGIQLALAWVASPPLSSAALTDLNITVTGNPTNGQIRGIDYDIIDIGYEFFYRRFISEGWGAQQLRYRPLKSMISMSFIYPLLNEFFAIPRTWMIEDWDAAMLRIVPSVNVQMLPLFAMQLAFMGFAQSLPQAMYMQYIAGLDQTDLCTRWSFMKTLVLTQAAIILLNILQGSVNFGAIRQATSVDGLRYDVSYPNTGAAYGGLIQTFQNQRDSLMKIAVDMVRGVVAWISL